MRRIFKALSFAVVLIIMLISMALPAFATQAETPSSDSENITVVYNPDFYGRFTCKANVPEGFNEVVCLVFMDNYGGPQNFLLMPENNYELQDEVICGPYQISGYVNNDTMLEYKVTRSVDTVEITEDAEINIELTVSGGPTPEEEIPVIEDTPTEAESEDVNTTDVDSETDKEISEEAGTESENLIVQENNTSADTDTGTEVIEDETEDERPKEKSTLQKLLISLIGSAVFVGFIAGIVYLVRKYIEVHR